MEEITLTRLTAVRQKLPEWEIEGLLITNPANRRWLSGFTGSNAQLLITADKAILATDFRYYERVQIEAPHFELFKHERSRQQDRAFLTSTAVKRIGIEASHVTLEQAAHWRSLRTGIKWVHLPQTIEPLRAIKSKAEIQIMRRAAVITDQVMSQFAGIARPGISEKALAWTLEQMLHDAGADGPAFPIIVASGPNSALPHHTVSGRTLQKDDLVIVDMGASLQGYHSDQTRTFYMGSKPDDQFWEIYNLVLQAQKNVLANIKPGMTVQEADALARDIIEAADHGEHFGHGLGHGVGLEIHENPLLSKRAPAEAKLQTGMTTTIEPGIYIPGWGGVRIEDLVWLQKDGVRRLTHCPKSPIILLAR
ncbi:MAG: aminopeptidase P family protein [Chloroflexi bacterium]|nr:aminopeptidase P family protein [Chloroflexota bacterium]